MYSIVTRQKFSNFGYLRNKSNELSMSKMKKVIHLYLYFMALYMHILLNCVCYQISYFFLLLLFISSCSSYYFYCGMKKLSRHSIFDHFHAFHSCTVLFHRFLRQFCTIIYVRNVSTGSIYHLSLHVLKKIVVKIFFLIFKNCFYLT